MRYFRNQVGFILISLSLLGAIASGAPETPTAAPTALPKAPAATPVALSGPLFHGFHLSASLEKEIFLAQEPVVVILKLKNTTSQSKDLYGITPEHAFDLVAKNPKGTEVPLTEAGRDSKAFLSLGGEQLKSKAEAVYKLHVDQLIDISKPGKYSLIVYRSIPNPDYGPKDNNLNIIGLHSNEVKFEVKAAEGKATVPPATVQDKPVASVGPARPSKTPTNNKSPKE